MVIRSEVLKEKLQQYGWSQNELAIKANLSKGTISRVLNGKRGSGRKVIAALLRTFPDETLESLFKEKSSKPI
ncbi:MULTISPECIES: helix-turn-helix domain-containing protein [unclassified Clostridium]|uniref:helix-turn-helix domain-containing protein n=1 Tax=unclassified Clostridium TaxID=2614128 RepID=UPI003F90E1AE